MKGLHLAYQSPKRIPKITAKIMLATPAKIMTMVDEWSLFLRITTSVSVLTYGNLRAIHYRPHTGFMLKRRIAMKANALRLLLVIAVTMVMISAPVHATGSDNGTAPSENLCTVKDWMDVTEKPLIDLRGYPDCPNGYKICRSCRVWKQCHGGQGRYYWCCDGYLYYPCCA